MSDIAQLVTGRVGYIGSHTVLELLQAADPRQSEVVEAQAAFNSMPTALRIEAAGKGELHALVEALLEKLAAWANSAGKKVSVAA